MSQVTIYLPDELEKKARKAARAAGSSFSAWIAEQLAADLDDSWPQSVLDAAGSIPDFPGIDEIRAGYGADSTRENL